MATAARTTAPRLLKAEEMADLPEDVRAELVDGVMVMVPLASGGRGSVASRLMVALGGWVYERALGELFDSSTGFILRRDPDVLRAPDLAFVAAERLHAVPRTGFIELAPDLAVEILSPSNTWQETERRLTDFFGAGVRLVWLIDPATRAVTALTGETRGTPARWLGEDESLDGGDVLPGFTVPIARLFTGLAREDAPDAPPPVPGA